MHDFKGQEVTAGSRLRIAKHANWFKRAFNDPYRYAPDIRIVEMFDVDAATFVFVTIAEGYTFTLTQEELLTHPRWSRYRVVEST
jgi:hypothetical protein